MSDPGRMVTARGPRLCPDRIYGQLSDNLARLRAGLVDLARAGSAGQMEADVCIEPAVALARMYTRLGMRLCALELCSVY